MPAGLHEAIRGEIIAGLNDDGPWDAVYLSLHGALVAEGVDSPDRELIEAVRAAIGNTPLAVTFDLHANVDPAIAPLVDVSAGYKTHPHVDMDATATRVFGLLDRMMAGDIRPVRAVAKTGKILPSINMRTAAGPMACSTRRLWRHRLAVHHHRGIGYSAGRRIADQPGRPRAAHGEIAASRPACLVQVLRIAFGQAGQFRISRPHVEALCHVGLDRGISGRQF